MKSLATVSRWGRACVRSLVPVAFLLLLPGLASAVNVLNNGSFESPVVTGCGNHVGTQPNGGWFKTGAGGWNIVWRDSSCDFVQPPYQTPNAQNGTQYLDIDGSGNYVYQSFNLTGSSVVQFSAWFSNRESGGLAGDYISTIGIYNDSTNGTLRSSLVTVDLSAGAKPSTTWTQGAGSVVLPSGNYRIRINLNNYNNVDNVVADVTPGTAALQVIKQLSPTDDPGKFNITDSTTTITTTIGTDLGHNGTTGLVAVTSSGGGVSHTIAETAGTGTNLTDYAATYSCTCTGGTCSGSPVTGSGYSVNFSVRNNNVWTCTFTNTRKQVCRILSLKSNGTVTPPGSMLFGTAAYIATWNGIAYDIAIKTGIGEGNFTGNGLIYNDGQFPLLSGPPCNNTTEQCFPFQNAFSTATVTNLSGLTVGTATGPAGTTITFGAGTYTYAGPPVTKFQNGHMGTYTATRNCGTAPEPGTFVLMVLPLAGLRAIRRRWRHA